MGGIIGWCDMEKGDWLIGKIVAGTKISRFWWDV